VFSNVVRNFCFLFNLWLLVKYFYLAIIIGDVWFPTSARHLTTNPPHHGAVVQNHHKKNRSFTTTVLKTPQRLSSQVGQNAVTMGYATAHGF